MVWGLVSENWPLRWILECVNFSLQTSSMWFCWLLWAPVLGKSSALSWWEESDCCSIVWPWLFLWILQDRERVKGRHMKTSSFHHKKWEILWRAHPEWGLVVQWVRLCVSIAGVPGSPGGTAKKKKIEYIRVGVLIQGNMPTSVISLLF